ncbi:hypothetical protein [Bdellovibrio sp. HCB2-146]|uniref:hypothetical protein n=1 Tax=Bdellovibrio sp. HCB2-146 TaxID=3394362 RepID=UPI0039BD18EA
MTMNPLPPQAYTKETLLKAYQWLMGQNSSLKEIATTPDILVSLYLKATRDGDHALERPSIQNFKNELRSLAGMMGELDRPAGAQSHAPQMQQMQQMHLQPQAPQQHAPPPPPPQQPLYHQTQAVPQHIVTTPTPTPAQAVQMVAEAQVARPAAPPMVQPATTTQVSYTEKTLMATTQSQDMMNVLDCSTRAMIQEVKDEFNLSSDLEALRMLIKIGYSRSKGLLR